MKKILFISPKLGGGGSERVMTHLANHLDRSSYIPEILLIQKANHNYLEFLKADVFVRKLEIETKYYYSSIKILRAIISRKPDVVFINSRELNLLLSLFIPFFRKYRWIARETNTLSQMEISRVKRFLFYKTYKNYDVIITQCKHMKGDLIKMFHLDSEKVKILNNPIDTKLMDAQLSDESNVTLPKDKLNLVACGRLSYEKGFDLLIEAFSKLAHRKDYHLTILGVGNEKNINNQEKKLKSMVETKKLEKEVSFVGFHKNIFKWLRASDIFILSSRYEGFSNVLLEALYCGTPVLANGDVGGVDEIVFDDVNGCKFSWKKGDFEAKLQHLVKVEINSRDIRRTITPYSIENVMLQFQDIL